MRTLLSLVVGAVAMFSPTGTASVEAPDHCPTLAVARTGPLPGACARVEGDDLGRLPLALTVGGEDVRVDEWAVRDIDGRELVGFASELPGDVVYVVHAGGESFADVRTRWLHPAGVVGPKSKAIDAVTFCRVPARVDGCPAPVVVE